MSQTETTINPDRQEALMEKYYRFHAKIYDATRWGFLFGRTRALELVAEYGRPKRVLEIGCGTGRNLALLRRIFPGVDVTGIDASKSMLDKAGERIRGDDAKLLRMTYDRPLSQGEGKFDLVLASYCLSMINPGWRKVIDAAVRDLRPKGILAVVDFNQSRFATFKRWMALNHVRMDGHLLPALREVCDVVREERETARLLAWEYFVFIGRRK